MLQWETGNVLLILDMPKINKKMSEAIQDLSILFVGYTPKAMIFLNSRF